MFSIYQIVMNINAITVHEMTRTFKSFIRIDPICHIFHPLNINLKTESCLFPESPLWFFDFRVILIFHFHGVQKEDEDRHADEQAPNAQIMLSDDKNDKN